LSSLEAFFATNNPSLHPPQKTMFTRKFVSPKNHPKSFFFAFYNNKRENIVRAKKIAEEAYLSCCFLEFLLSQFFYYREDFFFTNMFFGWGWHTHTFFKQLFLQILHFLTYKHTCSVV
jgi:hypothetical protein